jgi:UDP-glucose 4-epimerase
VPFKGKRVLVTGASGFLGSHLVDHLVQLGATVTGLDSLHSGSLENLAQSRDAMRFIQGDVRDLATVQEACSAQDIVFHLAANADVPASVRDPDYDFETNLAGTQRVFRSCLEKKVGRVIFAASAAVYGNPRSTPITEEHPRRPISPYGASKLGAEQLGLVYHQVYGLPFTSVRIFNSYGERQARYVMYDVLNKLRHAPAVLDVLGTGKQVRNFCYVEDACHLFLQAAVVPEAVGQVFNLAGDDPISIADLVHLLVRLTGLTGKTEVRFTGQSWPGDIAQLIGDAGRAHRVLGFHPKVELQVGLMRLMGWFERVLGWTLQH